MLLDNTSTRPPPNGHSCNPLPLPFSAQDLFQHHRRNEDSPRQITHMESPVVLLRWWSNEKRITVHPSRTSSREGHGQGFRPRERGRRGRGLSAGRGRAKRGKLQRRDQDGHEVESPPPIMGPPQCMDSIPPLESPQPTEPPQPSEPALLGSSSLFSRLLCATLHNFQGRFRGTWPHVAKIDEVGTAVHEMVGTQMPKLGSISIDICQTCRSRPKLGRNRLGVGDVDPNWRSWAEAGQFWAEVDQLCAETRQCWLLAAPLWGAFPSHCVGMLRA